MTTTFNRARAFILNGCNMERSGLTEEDLTLDFWQQFFKRASDCDDQLDGQNIRSFLRKRLHQLTDEMFVYAGEHRMNLLCILRPFCFDLWYRKGLHYFEGLAFDMEEMSYQSARFDDDLYEARQHNLSPFETEVKLSLKYNNKIEYILLQRHTREDIDRLIGFSEIKSDIVVANLSDFWNYASVLISQEQLNALPECQIRDIPEVFKARLQGRHLQL